MPRSAKHPESSAPITVFVVDDVPHLRAVLRIGIEQDPEFAVVGEAGDGRGAIDGVERTDPAAVVLDLSMPDMDGFQAIPEIRSRRPGVAIIVLSGFPPDRMRKKVRERGADDYLEKGSSVEELRQATRSAVAARQRRAA